MTARRQRSGRRGAILGGLLGLALGCVDIGVFGCERDSQCELEGVEGRCFEPGYCALPDGACDSGYRYHEGSVPEDLAGRCAPPPEPEAGSSSSSSGPGESSSSGLVTTTGGSSSDEGSSSTGNDCGDHPCGCTASLAVGTNHTCVARFDGRVVCWGANGYAELGMAETSTPVPWPRVVPIPGELLIDEVEDGNNHTCGRASNDSVLCWGRNASGEIAPELRDTFLGPTPLALEEPPGVIALAPQHTCVASPTGPAVRCLGNNGNGELGGTGPDPIDGSIPGMQAIDQMSLGRDHSCALAGGQVFCWGRNNVGQIGDGTNALADTPTPILAPLPAKVVSMSGRLDTTCALLEDGDVYCWGGIYGVELGTAIEPEMELTEPMRVDVIDELPEPVVEVEVGASHLCARAESGRLWCWGRDNNEQLGPIDPPVGKKAVELDVECPDGAGR